MIKVGSEFGAVLCQIGLFEFYKNSLKHPGRTSSSARACRKVFMVVLAVVNGSVLPIKTPTLATVSLRYFVSKD